MDKIDYRIAKIDGEWIAVIEHTKDTKLKIQYSAPEGKGWEFVDFKVFQIEPANIQNGLQGLKTKKEIMRRYWDGWTQEAIDLYVKWPGTYEGYKSGSSTTKQSTFEISKGNVGDEVIEITDNKNRNLPLEDPVYDIILRFRDDKKVLVFIDPPIRNEYN